MPPPKTRSRRRKIESDDESDDNCADRHVRSPSPSAAAEEVALTGPSTRLRKRGPTSHSSSAVSSKTPPTTSSTSIYRSTRFAERLAAAKALIPEPTSLALGTPISQPLPSSGSKTKRDSTNAGREGSSSASHAATPSQLKQNASLQKKTMATRSSSKSTSTAATSKPQPQNPPSFSSSHVSAKSNSKTRKRPWTDPDGFEDDSCELRSKDTLPSSQATSKLRHSQASTASSSSSKVSPPSQGDSDDRIEEFGDAAVRTEQVVEIESDAAEAIEEKAKQADPTPLTATSESLWVDKYAPATEDQLGVNPKKIEEVRNALLKALSAPSGGQIILLSGPSGAGKSAVVHVLARELDLDILEWINPIDTSKFESLTARNDREVAAESGSARTWSNSFDEGKPSISNRFADFLSHARKSCPLAFVSTYSNHSLANAPQPGNPDNEPHRRVIVVEDLPNVLNASTRSSFYSALRAFVHSPRTAHPLILIATDTVVGAADGDMKWRERSMNVGNIIPTDLKQLPSVQKITFQPSANLFLIKALTRIASAELKPSGLRCTKDYLTSVCTASGGDIRCAINTLQFSSWPESVSAPATKTLKRGRKDKIVVLDRGKRQGDVGAREVGLVLFHAISKILMSKTLSSGEPEDVFPGAEPPIKPADIELSRVDLPQHLRTHERDRFKSHAENVFEASHTDAPTFVSFLSENYPPFFTEIEECASAADCLSKADALTSMHTLQATSSSYLASLATRGIMHSRRTPLPTNHFGRALHPIVKPKLFEATKTARETATAVLERSRQWSLSWMTRNKDVFAASEWGECGGGQATGFQLTTCHSKHDITHHLLPYIGKISGFTPASRGVHLELDPTEELLITSLSHYSFRRQSYFAHKEKLSDREVFLAEEEEAEGTAGMAANLEPPGPLSERDATRIQHGATGVPAGGHSVGTSLLGSGVIVPPVLAGGADPNGWVDPMDDIEDSD